MSVPIHGFEGEYSFLSNFASSLFYVGGIIYATNEHFYQAQKTLDFDTRLKIASAPTPGNAKTLGRKCDIRSDWEQIKESVMLFGLRAKFYTSPGFSKLLLDTGNAYLEETNHWGDTYWGVCNKVGENRLGHLLMQVRDELRQVTIDQSRTTQAA